METAETAGRPPSPAEDADPHGVDVWDLQSAGRAAAMTSSEEVDPEQENDIEVYRKYLESHALSADEILEEVGRERPFKAALLMAPENAGVLSLSREEIKSVLDVKVVSWEESWTDRTGHPQRQSKCR